MDEAAERDVGNADQANMHVLAIEQAACHRLIGVLEPMCADDIGIARRRRDKAGIRLAALLLGIDRRHTIAKRSAIFRAEVKLGNQDRFVRLCYRSDIEAMLRHIGIRIDAHHIAIPGTGRHGFRRIDCKTSTQE